MQYSVLGTTHVNGLLAAPSVDQGMLLFCSLRNAEDRYSGSFGLARFIFLLLSVFQNLAPTAGNRTALERIVFHRDPLTIFGSHLNRIKMSVA